MNKRIKMAVELLSAAGNVLLTVAGAIGAVYTLCELILSHSESENEA